MRIVYHVVGEKTCLCSGCVDNSVSIGTYIPCASRCFVGG
jgi:hypothetical protein